MARVLLTNEEGTNFEKALNLIPDVKGCMMSYTTSFGTVI